LGYDTLANKIPIMIGFNVPTFKALDILAIECECTAALSEQLQEPSCPGADYSYPVLIFQTFER